MTSVLKRIKLFHKYKIRKGLLDIIIKKRLKNDSFAIVSNNCWGGGFYQALKKPYNTPFVGLFINSPCYIRLLKNFWFYVDSELKFTKTSKYGNYNNKEYPIGVLGDDIEIHFLHYESDEEARDKWCRRKNKLPRDENKLFFKFDDRDFCTDELVAEFHQLPFQNKLSFTKKKYLGELNNIALKNPKGFILFDSTFDHFDPIHWINTGQVQLTKTHCLILKIISYPVKFNQR